MRQLKDLPREQVQEIDVLFSRRLPSKLVLHKVLLAPYKQDLL